MRIFQITMDSSCFAAFEKRQKFENEIEELIELNNKGWIDLIKPDVLEKETQDFLEKAAKIDANKITAFENLKNKTKTLATDYGIGLYGHTYSKWIVGDRKSKLIEVYTALWGKPLWQKGKQEKNKIRDAIHLDTHLINERDFFVTNDRHFLYKMDVLKKKFDVEILNPKECLEKIKEYWLNNSGSSQNSSQNFLILPPRIIAGTCLFQSLNLRTPEGQSIFSISTNTNAFYFIKGIIYDFSGDILFEIKDRIEIYKEGACLHGIADPAREAKILLEDKLYPHIIFIFNSEKLLEAKVLGDGSLWLFGKFYNKKGQQIAYFNKNVFKIGPAPICI